MNLDSGQRAFADVPAGPVLALAGAGTGKTHALMARVVALLNRGVDPQSLLLLTFTQKAAREMESRLSHHLAAIGRQVWTGTFHRLAAQVLREEGYRLGYTESFTIHDQHASVQMMRQLVDDLALDLSPEWGERILRVFSLTVNADLGLADALRKNAPQLSPHHETISVLQDAYCLRKLQSNVMDYDDLLAHFYLLLESVLDLRTALSARFRHILVDEYQDVNRLQALILDLLAGPDANLAVVGDDAQSIYGFRGADVGQIRSFVHRYPGAQIVRLEKNYRASPQLVSLANRCNDIMIDGFQKTLEAVSAPGPMPQAVRCLNFDHEAAFIVERIQMHRDEGISLDDQAVLVRTHDQMKAVEKALCEHGVPFRIAGATALLHTKQARTILDHIRILANPQDMRAWRNVLRSWPGIGPIGSATIEAHLFGHMSPWDTLEMNLSEDDIGVRTWRAFQQFRAAALRAFRAFGNGPRATLEAWSTQPSAPCFTQDDGAEVRALLLDTSERTGSIFEFLDRLNWNDGDGRDSVTSKQTAVTLSTVHRSKGLEWSVVFVTGLVEGRFPLAGASKTCEQVEEERRLFYVAVTRARRQLYVCIPGHRGGAHGPVPMMPSRFVTDLIDLSEPVIESWHVEAPC